MYVAYYAIHTHQKEVVRLVRERLRARVAAPPPELANLVRVLFMAPPLVVDEGGRDHDNIDVPLEHWEVNETLATLIRIGLQRQPHHWYPTQGPPVPITARVHSTPQRRPFPFSQSVSSSPLSPTSLPFGPASITVTQVCLPAGGCLTPPINTPFVLPPWSSSTQLPTRSALSVLVLLPLASLSSGLLARLRPLFPPPRLSAFPSRRPALPAS
eukprot:2972404-Pyramimonas_sp.AAC.2